jgi:hypothetical protein
MSMNKPDIEQVQRAVATSLHEHWVLFLPSCCAARGVIVWSLDPTDIIRLPCRSGGSWSPHYILLWIANDQKTAPMRPARAKQARNARSGMRTKLTRVNAIRRFRAQHYV